MTEPQENVPQDDPTVVHPDTDTDESEVEPAFDVDLDPEDQGTAEAAAEQTG